MCAMFVLNDNTVIVNGVSQDMQTNKTEEHQMSSLVTTKEMFERAYREHFAVGAFNFNHMELIQAIVGAAAETRSPVILQASSFTAKYADLGYFVAIAEYAAEKAGIPVALHLDHGEDLEAVKKFISAGFTSVMIDGSHLSYDENVALTKKVCDYAHERGVVVEGELGTISGIEDNIGSEKGLYTDPEQAADFVSRTGVDSLAVAIGTSHGAYKFKPGQDPKLRLDLLDRIESLLPGLPIVLHGASSVNQKDVEIINTYGGKIESAIGIPPKMLTEAAKKAVCKVNVDTDLRLAMTGAVREVLCKEPGVIDTRKYIGAGRERVRERIIDKMENVLLSAGRY